MVLDKREFLWYNWVQTKKGEIVMTSKRMMEFAKLLEEKALLEEKLRELKTRIDLEALGITEYFNEEGINEISGTFGTLTRKKTRSVHRKKDRNAIEYVEQYFPELVHKDFNTRSLTSKLVDGVPNPEEFEQYFIIEEKETIVLK